MTDPRRPVRDPSALYVPTAEWLGVPHLTDEQKERWMAQVEPPPRRVTDSDPRREALRQKIAEAVLDSWQRRHHVPSGQPVALDVADAVLSVLPECRHEQVLRDHAWAISTARGRLRVGTSNPFDVALVALADAAAVPYTEDGEVSGD